MSKSKIKPDVGILRFHFCRSLEMLYSHICQSLFKGEYTKFAARLKVFRIKADNSFEVALCSIGLSLISVDGSKFAQCGDVGGIFIKALLQY
mmetsp:Transcript_1465/g.2841  ORF Transcript_1465/g.2841 Transcript_1465/m.2841 type:complete len:92 (+) Transcript_1465:601-876(+)